MHKYLRYQKKATHTNTEYLEIATSSSLLYKITGSFPRAVALIYAAVIAGTPQSDKKISDLTDFERKNRG